MNRHFRGPAHGLPVEAIERDCCKVSSWGFGVVLKESWHARIIEDNLLLRKTYSFVQWRRDTRLPKGFIDRHKAQVCRHLAMQGPPEYLHDGDLGSCARCPTDYYIHIDWERGIVKLDVLPAAWEMPFNQ